MRFDLKSNKHLVAASLFALTAAAIVGSVVRGRSHTSSAVASAVSAPSGKSTATSSTVNSNVGNSTALGVATSTSPGTPALTVAPASGTATAAVAPAKPLPPPELAGCFVQTFTHEKLATHDDGEECLKHRNLIQLSQEGLHPSKIAGASICVKVNGSPVKYTRVKGHGDLILIGAEAGPQAEISVRYCLGKALCPEDCTVKRDDFLAAIGGDTGADSAGWDASSDGKNRDAEVEKEMAALSKEMGGSGVEGGVFKGWKQKDVKTAQACGSNGPSRAVATAK